MGDLKCNRNDVWDKWNAWTNASSHIPFKRTKDKRDTAVGNGERKLAAEISSTIKSLGGQNDPTDINDTYRNFGFGYISVKEFSLKCNDVRLGKQASSHYAEFLTIFIDPIYWWLTTYYYTDDEDKMIKGRAVQDNIGLLTQEDQFRIEQIRAHLMDPIIEYATSAKATPLLNAEKTAFGIKEHKATKKPIIKKGIKFATKKGTKQAGGVPKVSDTAKYKKSYSLNHYIRMGEICASRLAKLYELVLSVLKFASPYMDNFNSFAAGFGKPPEPSSWHFFLGEMVLPPHIKSPLFTYICKYLHLHKISINNFEVLDNIARQEALGGPKIQKAVMQGMQTGMVGTHNLAPLIKGLHKEDEPVLVIVNEECGFYFVGEKTINQVKAKRVSQRGVKLGFSSSSLIYQSGCNRLKATGFECNLDAEDKECDAYNSGED